MSVVLRALVDPGSYGGDLCRVERIMIERHSSAGLSGNLQIEVTAVGVVRFDDQVRRLLNTRGVNYVLVSESCLKTHRSDAARNMASRDRTAVREDRLDLTREADGCIGG